MERKFLRAKEVAEIYGIPEGTLSQWRTRKTGPDYVKIGGAVRYSVEALDDFFESNRIRCVKGEK